MQLSIFQTPEFLDYAHFTHRSKTSVGKVLKKDENFSNRLISSLHVMQYLCKFQVHRQLLLFQIERFEKNFIN